MLDRKIIFYYQTFTSLKPILIQNTLVTHIHLSSIHFGINTDKSPYIHLNDYPPNNKIFDNMWNEIKCANKLGIKIILMIGGAGGAFDTLFSDFDVYYNLLKNTINEYPCISGIDLDVEETTSVDNIKYLIKKIKNDFGKKFIISMAPVSYAIESNNPGLGGFIYKELYDSPEGRMIDYFNGQFYYDIAEKSYDEVMSNNFPPEKIVFGMESCNDIILVKKIVERLSNKYKNFGGVFNWEYFNADKQNPYDWVLLMHHAMYKNYNNMQIEQI